MAGMTQGDKPLMTVTQVASYFRVDPRTVRTWVKEGLISSIRTPTGRIRIPYSEVRRVFLETMWPAPGSDDVS